jgi:ankyrin repeat protein
VQQLLAARADANRLDRDGRSPLFVALFEQHAAVAEALVRHRGTDLRQPSQGYAPRAWAQQMQQDALVQLIDERLARR